MKRSITRFNFQILKSWEKLQKPSISYIRSKFFWIKKD